MLLELRKPGIKPEFEVWKENLESLEIFLVLQTQWHRVAGLSRVTCTGLMYSEATNYMRERGIRRARRLELLEDLRVMERAALETWNGAADG